MKHTSQITSYCLLLPLVLTLLAGPAMAETYPSRKVCVWDPVGKNGPVMAFFGDLVPAAIHWGVDLQFVPYADENQAAEDLRRGACSMAIVTAILARDFVEFAGTLDAIGALTSKRSLKMALATLTRERAGPLMMQEDFEVVAAMPIGSMYAFVKDRRINSIDAMRGKKIASLNNDIQTQTFARLADATAVSETLSTFAGNFNSGKLDVVLMPALAYNTFELYRGLGDQGGIIEDRMFYGMLTLIARHDDFGKDFGQRMREYSLQRLSAMMTMIKEAEETIPRHYWIRTDASTKAELEKFFKDIRLTLKVENKFDARALSMLWKIRCSDAPSRAECVMPDKP